MTIKVLIADDHKLFRQGLKSLMRTREDLIEVVGEAATGTEAVRLAEKLHPDVILMDIYMPEGDGLQATKEIRLRAPEISIVMLTSSEQDEHLYEAIQLGASGYLLKTLDADELFNLLESVAGGDVALTRTMASRLARSISKGESKQHRVIFELTGREMEILQLVACGATNPEIAEQLFITVNTVKSHLSNILNKLQVENRTQAAAYAIQTGLAAPHNH